MRHCDSHGAGMASPASSIGICCIRIAVAILVFLIAICVNCAVRAENGRGNIPSKESKPKQSGQAQSLSSSKGGKRVKFRLAKIKQPEPGARCPFAIAPDSIRYNAPFRIHDGQSVTYTNYDFQAFIQDGIMMLHVCRNREHIAIIQFKKRNLIRDDTNAHLLCVNEIDVTMTDFNADDGSALFVLEELRYNAALYPELAEDKDWVLWSQNVIKSKRSNMETKTPSCKQEACRDWDWDEEEEEDAFGNITHTSEPLFEEAGARIEGGQVFFRLNVLLKGQEDEESRVACKEANVYVTADHGATWRKVSLRLMAEEKKNNRQRWEGEIALSELTHELNPQLVYFFNATDTFGNMTTELPYTKPGWPADPAMFFPAAGDMDNSADIIEASLDLLDNWVASDGKYLYLASRYEGPVTPGSAHPPYYHVYATKFSNPAVDKNEGLTVGVLQAFAPMISYPSELLRIEAIVKGDDPAPDIDAPVAESINDSRKREYSVGIGVNMLYTRTDLHALCPDGCGELRIVFFTAAYPGTHMKLPIPLNASHYTHVIFQTRMISAGQPPQYANSGTSQNSPPIAATIFFPDVVSDNNGRMSDYLSASDVVRETGSYVRWLLSTSGSLPQSFYARCNTDSCHSFEGSGPFTIDPGDTVVYRDYRFKAYSRKGRLKVAIYRNGRFMHTIMIGKDTISSRDSQYSDEFVHVSLSNFTASLMSAEIVVSDAFENNSSQGVIEEGVNIALSSVDQHLNASWFMPEYAKPVVFDLQNVDTNKSIRNLYDHDLAQMVRDRTCVPIGKFHHRTFNGIVCLAAWGGNPGDIWVAFHRNGVWTPPMFSGITMQDVTSRAISKRHFYFGIPMSDYTLDYTKTDVLDNGIFQMLKLALHYRLRDDRAENKNTEEHVPSQKTSIEMLLNANAIIQDSDGDGMTDFLEKRFGLDPHNPDTDNDGINDLYDTNPHTKISAICPDTYITLFYKLIRETRLKSIYEVSFEGEQSCTIPDFNRVILKPDRDSHDKDAVNIHFYEPYQISDGSVSIRVDINFGILHGHGSIYTLKKDNDKWRIISVDQIWIS